MTIRIFVFSIFVVVVSSLRPSAQTPSRDQEKGFIPGVPYAVSDTGNVNLTNGNLAYSLPLGSLPQGRGSATAGVFLLYNSKLWKKHVEYIPLSSGGGTTRQTFLSKDPYGGWRYGMTYSLMVTSRNDGLDEPLQVCSRPGAPANLDAIYVTKVQIGFPDGTKIEFWPTGYTIPSTVHGRFFNVTPTGRLTTLSGGCSVTTTQSSAPFMTYYSVDGSYMNLRVYPNSDWELSLADGSRVINTAALGQRIYDRNGNYVRFGYVTLPDGSQATGWIDQFERYVARKTTPTEDTIYRFGFGGQMLQTKVRWKTVTVIQKYQTECSDCGFTRGQTSPQVAYMTFRVVDNIQSPNGLISTFDYHAHDGDVPFNPGGGTTNQNWSPGWGEVKSLTMPSSAKTEYDFKIYTAPIVDELLITPTFVLDRSGRTTVKTLSYDEQYGGETFSKKDKWLYTTGKTGGGFVGPDGRGSGQAFFHIDYDEDLGGQVYRTSNPDGTLTEKLWQFNNPSGFAPGKLVNPYVKAEFHTIRDSAGNPALTAIKNFTYDKNGNVLQVDEYDWVSYWSIPRDQSGRVTGLPLGSLPLRRVTKTTYFNPTPTAADSSTLSDNAFWKSGAPRLRSLASAIEIHDESGVPQSRSEMTYDHTNYDAGNTKGGNRTETRLWDSFKGGTGRPYSNPLTTTNSINTSSTYNAYGMPVTETDARGYVTQIIYGNVTAPTGTVTDLYPTGIITAVGTSAARASSTVYDFYSGVGTSTTDVDNNVTVATEYDIFGRPIKVRRAADSPLESWTRTEYDDVNRRIIVRSDIETTGDGRKILIKHFDELGRERLSRTLEDPLTEDPSNEAHGIKVETRYGYNDPTPSYPDDPANTLGDYVLVSNPFRAARSDQATNEETMGWTRSYSLRSGLRTEVQTFAGADLPAPWGGNANSTGVATTDVDANATTVIDQSGKARRNIEDALGQLVRVDEPSNTGELGSVGLPAQPTSYFYDVSGNLIRVVQGVQSRHFLYDSLGRLIRVRQPEQDVNVALDTIGNTINNSWTAGFSYDNNGNLSSSTDARNVVLTTVFDAQNRPITRTYSDTTPAAGFTYDEPTVPFSKGKLTKISSAVSELRYLTYDENGRLRNSEQSTDGRVYPSSYRYNLAGTLIEQTYPSDRVVKNFPEADGDVGSIASKVSNGPFKNYAASFSYTASGVIKHLQLGNGLWESARLNSRDQVTELNLGNSPTDGSLWKLNYFYGELDTTGNVNATLNSGNIAKQTIRAAGLQEPFVQTYRYDSLNRITEAKETVSGSQTWAQTFGYDRYGNRTSLTQNVGGQQLQLSTSTLPQIDPNTNRFQTGQAYAYDPVGNLIADPQGRKFTFNADNKQVEIRNAQGGVVGEYRYDASGKRVKKITATETTVFVYDGFGKLVAEMSNAAPVLNPTVSYTATDPLGSPRVLTDRRGNIVSRRDFMPFGEQLAADPMYRTTNRKYGVEDGVRKKFTGYERDDEAGLDFAEARYYNNAHGRFTAVDPLLASGKSTDPQTFNRYSYVMNRPLLLKDETGLQAGTPTGPNSVILPNALRGLAELSPREVADAKSGKYQGIITLTPKELQQRVELTTLAYNLGFQEGRRQVQRENGENVVVTGVQSTSGTQAQQQAGGTDSASISGGTSGVTGSVSSAKSESKTQTQSGTLTVTASVDSGVASAVAASETLASARRNIITEQSQVRDVQTRNGTIRKATDPTPAIDELIGHALLLGRVDGRLSYERSRILQ